jgi:hypothetical protein
MAYYGLRVETRVGHMCGTAYGSWALPERVQVSIALDERCLVVASVQGPQVECVPGFIIVASCDGTIVIPYNMTRGSKHAHTKEVSVRAIMQ